MADYFAHSLSGRPLEDWEPLSDHQTLVAGLAAQYAAVFGFAEAARLAGALHDVGKLSPEFQAYIRGERTSGGDHSSAGARILLNEYGEPRATILAAIIAAHHAGLADGVDFKRRMEATHDLVPKDWQAETGPLPPPAQLNPTRRFLIEGPKGFSGSFLTRMLFSCLVDADFIATEQFYAQANGEDVVRGGHTELGVLRERLIAFMAKKAAGAEETGLNALRAEILAHARAKAAMAPGLFTLTVPTGGGKTLTSLSFALDHALHHSLQRVIFVIPYTSIIEQTAQVFRDALGTNEDILEHHASFDWEEARTRKGIPPDDESPGAIDKLRRATENWDVPIVVTTAVQFFESLFANKTSRCRKLHKIAGSVIVLDEIQTLPLNLLLPCLAALDELQRNYSTSIVLCTATQPALRKIDGAIHGRKNTPLGLDIPEDRELAPRPAELYERLRRVAVERRSGPTADSDIAARFSDQPQMLCIVNTRKHAHQLFEAIRHLPGAVHLSTLMVPRHRRIVLAELRRKLTKGEAVRLVATSLIEAGVDISFPEVWRATAGIDNIAQAAGRCNREGTMPAPGRLVVFESAEVKPQHDIAQRWQAAQPAFERHADPLGLDAVHAYFTELYWRKGDPEKAFDGAMIDGRPGILRAIAERADTLLFPFASIAEGFRMIDDAMEPVIVPWRVHESDDEAEKLLKAIAIQERPSAGQMRQLQQYVVGIPKSVRDEWLARGVLREVHPALGPALLKFEDLAHYRQDTGVDLQDPTIRNVSMNIV